MIAQPAFDAAPSAEWLAGPGRSLTRFKERPLFREGLYRVARDSYAWMVPNGSWGETNIGLVDCGGRSVLIDTCWDLHYTRELMTHAAPVLERAPVEHVINTHADGDHCWGNQLFAGRDIIATQAAVKQMHHLKPASVTALKRVGRALLRLPFAHLDTLGRYSCHMFSPYDFRGVRLTSPTTSFSGETVLRVNGVELLIREVGPAHTDGDAYVYIPDRRVAYAGDLLFVGVTPVMWAGPLENLVAGLRQLMTLDVDVLVPGHGPLATKADVQDIIDYWDSLHESLHAGLQRGDTPLEAARAVALSAQFRSSRYARWDSPERIVTNAHTLYRHWGADTGLPPGTLGTLDLLRKQASLKLAMV